MKATMGNNIYKNSKVIGALALLLSISACGQGFKARESQELSSDDTYFQNLSVLTGQIKPNKERTPAASAAAAAPAPAPAANDNTKAPPVAANDNQPLRVKSVKLDERAQEKILDRYKHIDPKRQINTKLLKDALLFFFVNQKNFMNRKVITVIDYSLPSRKKRLFVIELRSGRVWSTYVAHGRGSDKNHDGLPEYFNNKLNSNATSVGAFITLSRYRGENGLSLRLKGLSKSNSNAYERNVVIHGASYVRDHSVKQGRSWGCPAVAPKYTAKLINTIKNGSLVYAGTSRPSLHRQL